MKSRDIMLLEYYDTWIALIRTDAGFWQQISPNYIYRGALINWCKRNNYNIVKER